MSGVEPARTDDTTGPALPASSGGVPAVPRAVPGPSQPTPGGPRSGAATQEAESVGRRAAEVERLPLADRADAFAALHDELRTRLEQGGDARV
ncbi:hypothetical protein DEJ33_11965 [Curtobacterium sp. MCPF17_047]|nr:hypothetical protein DEJ33_11965 [Curtobacterium sp. MCPF17_047]